MSNPITDLTNSITGGSNQNAQADLNALLTQIEAIQTPTAAQLQLDPLAQFTNAGQLTPAQMAAAQAGPSAYNAENLSQAPMSAMQQALSQDQAIASAQGMTPQEQAAIAQAIQSANTATAGQRGAIAQNFAGMGVPQSLISAALQNQSAGQNAENTYQGALQGQASAAQNALAANTNAGQLGSQMFGQEAGQANTVAAAQNALNQYNTANTQQANVQNQANTQAANVYNTTNAQNIGNQNVQGQQEVQYQNQVEAPQEAANLALQKGSEISGVGQAQAGQQTAAGQQAAGVFSGLVGGGAQVAAAGIAAADGLEVPPKPRVPATNFKQGGPVMGHARFPGNDRRNDSVPAMLSPGEVVLPRTVTHNPALLPNFLKNKAPQMAAKMPTPTHDDVAKVLRALASLNAGQ